MADKFITHYLSVCELRVSKSTVTLAINKHWKLDVANNLEFFSEPRFRFNAIRLKANKLNFVFG